MDVIIKNNLTFDTTLGLGTFYPCCEENKFIIEYYKYAVVEFLNLHRYFILQKESIDYL